MRTAIVLATLALSGCLAGGENKANEPGEGEVALGDQPARLVFAAEEAWSRFWEGRGEPTPAVDFARERAVVILLGDKANTCWAVDVSASVGAEVVDVNVSIRARAACFDAITQPIATASFPDRTKLILFHERLDQSSD